MKNTQNKIANFLKLGTLLLGFTLLLWNCERDEEVLHNVLNDNFNVTVKYNFNDVELLDKINNNLKTREKSTEINFKINTNYYKYIEKGNYHSYTFFINGKGNDEKLYNLLASFQKDGTYKFFLIEYKLFNNNQKDFYEHENYNLNENVSYKEVGSLFKRGEIDPCVQGFYEPCDNGGNADGHAAIEGVCGGSPYIISLAGCGGGSIGEPVDVSPGESSTTGDPASGESSTGGDTTSEGNNTTDPSTSDPTDVTVPIIKLSEEELALNEIKNCLFPNGLSTTEEFIMYNWLVEQSQITDNTTNTTINNFTKENNCSPEAESFANLVVKTLAENPDMTIEDVDFEDKIIYTKNPCVDAIIKSLQEKDLSNSTIPDLSGKSHLSQMVLDLFDHSKKYNLTFDIKQLNSLGSGVNGNTSGFNISLDTDLVKDATQLFIAKTVIHESLHAYIHYIMRTAPTSSMYSTLVSLHKSSGNKSNLTEHQFMGQYVEALAYSLSSYDNHQQPMDYYKALSWAGLESSNAYQSLSNTNKTKIQNIIQNERFNKSGAKSTKC